jgi:probable rRNA maturation factor
MSIEIENESAVKVDLDAVLGLAQSALAQLHIDASADIEILLVDEAPMESYHLDWMEESGATDVLSQPIDMLRPGKPGAITASGHLGLIVLCPQVAARQAETAGHSFMHEVLILTAHSILHLLGYDHAEPDDEREMFALQEQIVRNFVSEGQAL